MPLGQPVGSILGRVPLRCLHYGAESMGGSSGGCGGGPEGTGSRDASTARAAKVSRGGSGPLIVFAAGAGRGGSRRVGLLQASVLQASSLHRWFRIMSIHQPVQLFIPEN